MMDIAFRSQFDSTDWALVMTLEPQNFAPVYDSDRSLLHIQVTLKRQTYNDRTSQVLYPVLLDLHGKLQRPNSMQESGAQLQPPLDLPVSFVSPNIPQLVNLSFAFSAHYLQLLEEDRSSQQGQNMLLQMQMWGVVAIMKPRDDMPGVPGFLQSHSGEVIRFEKVSTESYSPQVRIARSDWVDRILPNLGYRHSVIIELPLIRNPRVSEVYLQAVEALDQARQAFAQEDYRGAIRHTRDVLEYFATSSQGGQITAFCNEHLAPLIGEIKSKSIDRSLNAMREIINAGSHFDPQKPFTTDRALAAYVIETLAVNLRFISSVFE
jgi:hypothetical protein